MPIIICLLRKFEYYMTIWVKILYLVPITKVSSQ